MTSLEQAISAAGMTPPKHLSEGRWLRFPGAGKSRSNRSGWCRVISPTLAIFGDWSSGLTQTWKDGAYQEDENSQRLLNEARQREREFEAAQRRKQAEVAAEAQKLVNLAMPYGHPYLVAKGFPGFAGLVHGEHLVVPVRDVDRYSNLMTAQLIAADGTKRFLPGGRARGGIHRLGMSNASHIALCEGYATGLSILDAMKRIYRSFAVVTCFSARNLELIATRYPTAVVCADNDASKTGEEAAKRTGLRWIMPSDVGTDFNDVMCRDGICAVINPIREVFAM